MSNSKISQVLKQMQKETLSQILVTSPSSVFYLTGVWMEPGERLLAVLLDEVGRVTIFANELFSKNVEGADFPCVLHKDSEDPLQGLSSKIKSGKLGVDKFWQAKFLLPLLEKRPEVMPVLGSSSVDWARMQKDEAERDLMRLASRQNDKAVAAVIREIREGVQETELAAALGDIYLELGADFPIGSLNVSFGANASDPHHGPGRAKLLMPQCVLFDIYTPFSHYWCDMTRTVFFKDVSAEEKRVYETVKCANEEAIKVVRPGILLSEIDRTARDVIADAGYGEFFTHRLGHGIGIDCHEPPDVSAVSAQVALPGMIFSIEPGIYLPGKTGVRIEDLVLVTESGCEVLNGYSKDLQVVG